MYFLSRASRKEHKDFIEREIEERQLKDDDLLHR
jgi:hypothetical protein